MTAIHKSSLKFMITKVSGGLDTSHLDHVTKQTYIHLTFLLEE